MSGRRSWFTPEGISVTIVLVAIVAVGIIAERRQRGGEVAISSAPAATAAPDPESPSPRTSRFDEHLERHLAVLKNDPGAADRLDYRDMLAWEKTIRKAYPRSAVCEADRRFRSAHFISKNLFGRLVAVNPDFFHREIGITETEFSELYREAAKEAVVRLSALLAHPAGGADCELDDAVKIADRIIDILRESKMAPEEAGVSADDIARRIRLATKR